MRSLSMDAISDKQYRILALGGNKKFIAFMEKYMLNSEAAKVKYRSKAAEYYRLKVRMCLKQFVAKSVD